MITTSKIEKITPLSHSIKLVNIWNQTVCHRKSICTPNLPVEDNFAGWVPSEIPQKLQLQKHYQIQWKRSVAPLRASCKCIIVLINWNTEKGYQQTAKTGRYQIWHLKCIKVVLTAIMDSHCFPECSNSLFVQINLRNLV